MSRPDRIAPKLVGGHYRDPSKEIYGVTSSKEMFKCPLVNDSSSDCFGLATHNFDVALESFERTSAASCLTSSMISFAYFTSFTRPTPHPA